MLKQIRGVAVVLAATGIVLPTPSVKADQPRSAQNRSTEVRTIADVRTTADGTLKGRVVDHSGESMKNAEVIVRQSNKEVARVRADGKGVFSIKIQKSGTYQISSGKTEGIFHVWNEQVAPPSSRQYALLVMGQNGARGQAGVFDALEPDLSSIRSFDPTIAVMTAGVIASVVIGAISLDKINKIDDRVSSLPPHSP